MKARPSRSNLRIAKSTIRRYFYIGAIIAIIVPTVLLAVIYANSLQKEYTLKVQQLSEGILAEKKRFLRNTVDLTIYLIETELKQAKNEAARYNLTDEQAETIAIERIMQVIREIRLLDNGYIWVNKVVNYAGGDNYAIRLIHPNLPATEGEWLSTTMQDSQGNFPYKVELEGIKQNGELFYTYYFKKMDSNITSHKMSFAKLYQPYDWVIATGIYIDDIATLIENETARMQTTYELQKTRSLIILFLAVLGSMLIIIVFEKLIRNLILNYESKIKSYTQYLEKVSTTDRLTGLFNRLKLDELLEQELNRANRYDSAFSILIIDIDWFKKINDQFGHQAGDLVIREIATLLINQSRLSDSVGRWGGEEFIIICPETTLEHAAVFGEKICTTVASHHFVNNLNLTCSVGISTFHKNDSIEALIKRADDALYSAKNAGRNQVKTEAASNNN